MVEDDGPPGVAEWVVTYGDMMSLLLTFFIMLVSLSEIKAESKYRSILEALQQYMGYNSGPVAPTGDHFPLNSVVSRLTSLGSFTNENIGRGGIRTQSVDGRDVRVFRSDEGKSRRVGDPIQFEPGDTTLSAKAQQELARISELLAGKPNKVEIRAHTSPDEEVDHAEKVRLTFLRARRIRDYLESQGIAHDRLRVTAASDIQPLPENDGSLISPDAHERAEILISNTVVTDYIGPQQKVSLRAQDGPYSSVASEQGQRVEGGEGVLR